MPASIGLLGGYEQWGFVADASNYSHVTSFDFNIAFANAPYFITTIMKFKENKNSTFFNVHPNNLTNSKAYVYYGGYGSDSNNTVGYYWFACGI